MSSVKIMVHAVWGTKNRFPFLTENIRPSVIDHIKFNAISKGIFVEIINGYTEHLHALIGLNVEMGIAKTMNLIKGESSYWINKQKLTDIKFEWADEYFAVSVSESQLHKVRKYIQNQEEHHKKVKFSQEYDDFLKYFGF